MKITKAALSLIAICYGGTVSAFGFNMGDSFNEGFDFDKGSDLDLGGSRMNWESPDNVWDTGTRTHKGFSWGGGPRSGPNWGFRDAPPTWGGYPPPPVYGWPMMPPPPQQVPVYRRPPAPPMPQTPPPREEKAQ